MNVKLGVLFMAVALSAPALADKMDKTAKADKGGKKTLPAKMSCEEFVALDEVERPKVVYWAVGYDKTGKPEDAGFDIQASDSLVPVLIEECKNAPKDSFWKRAKARFKKTF
jgi:hypothetical protein